MTINLRYRQWRVFDPAVFSEIEELQQGKLLPPILSFLSVKSSLIIPITAVSIRPRSPLIGQKNRHNGQRHWSGIRRQGRPHGNRVGDLYEEDLFREKLRRIWRKNFLLTNYTKISRLTRRDSHSIFILRTKIKPYVADTSLILDYE